MTTTTLSAPVPRVGTSTYLTFWVAVGVLSALGMTYGLAAMHGLGISDGTTAMTPATSVGVAALCYLAAAATHTRWVAWLGVPVFSGLAFVGLMVALPWWAIFVLAGGVLLLVGVLTGAGRITTVQALALLGFFGVAVVALYLSPRAGLTLAALSLASHALWDVWHYRRDVVVIRSMAVFCIGLDITMGGLCVALAVIG